MAKPSRYTREEIEKYVAKGFWKTTISNMWDRNANEYANKAAIEDLRTTLTWAGAKQWTDRMALNLLELGIKRDDVIVVQLPNCNELNLFRVASEKAGVLCIPVIANMREKEMEYILRYTDARAVVIPWNHRRFDHFGMIESMRSVLPKLEHVLVVDDKVPDGALSVARLANEPLGQRYTETSYLEERRYKPTETSIINLTTGTTGFPKFAEYPAAANAAWGEGQSPFLRLTLADIVAAIAPAARGPTLPVYYDAPWVGAKAVMLQWNGPEEALRAIEAKKVTVACLVPTQLAMMMEQFKIGSYDLSSIRVWYSAGALMPPSLLKEVEERIGGTVVIDYGLVDFGGLIVQDFEDPQGLRMHTVGKPRFGTEIMIVDEDGKAAKIGNVGEILGRGPTCSSGYYKDPKATSESWNKDGWFAMGDLGKIDEQGNLSVVGRKKDMIIRGGQNIYPSEIENLLITHPKILEVAIVAMPDPVMGEKACAYVVLRTGESLILEEMTAFLREKNIASFKIPERLEIIDRLPVVSGQKVDKKSLGQDIAKKLSNEKEDGE
ncbi:MAG: acyl--CoA ligase [Deltaproteobacteria bacterium]|nr:acyl--CoA ligase [Deltaproteobacteria bacterium]